MFIKKNIFKINLSISVFVLFYFSQIVEYFRKL